MLASFLTETIFEVKGSRPAAHFYPKKKEKPTVSLCVFKIQHRISYTENQNNLS